MQLYLKFGSPVRILNKSVNSLIFSPIQTVFIIWCMIEKTCLILLKEKNGHWCLLIPGGQNLLDSNIIKTIGLIELQMLFSPRLWEVWKKYLQKMCTGQIGHTMARAFYAISTKFCVHKYISLLIPVPTTQYKMKWLAPSSNLFFLRLCQKFALEGIWACRFGISM